MRQCLIVAEKPYVDKLDARKPLSLTIMVQKFHKKFVLAANPLVVVWRMHYINILMQERSSAKIHEHNLHDKRFVVDLYRCHVAGKLGMFVDKYPGKHPMLYQLPKLNTIPYKSHLLLNLNSKQICIHLLTVRLTAY